MAEAATGDIEDIEGRDDDGVLPEPPADGPGLFGEAAPAVAVVTARRPGEATAYRVLARKYRPVGFDDLIGQEALVRVLRRAFAVGRVAHAFMLTGVRGVGKTTSARILARALNCIGPDGTGGPTADPCGACPNCVAILADRHPDVVEMDAASRTGVDDVREVIEATRFRPMQARTKVFIVDEVHMLSRNAFNALLKTLEEPPSHVTFIFATTELRKVPVTVLSRCQRFDLRRVREGELAALFGRIAGLEGVEVEAEALALIARAADGSVRDGLSLLDQAIAHGADVGAAGSLVTQADVAQMLGLADRAAVFALLEAAMGGRPAEALDLLGAAVDRGADPGLVLTDLLELVHLVTRLRTMPALGGQGSELTELERVRGCALAERLGIAPLTRAWQLLLKGIGEVEQAPNRRSAAEMVLIRLCHVAELPTPGELVRRIASAERGSQAGVEAAVPSPSPPPQGGSGAFATRGSLATAEALAPDPAPVRAMEPQAPMPGDWREIVALVAERGRDPMLHAHLWQSVHPVRVARGVVEIRLASHAVPRDLAARLAGKLTELTGIRWTVALSREAGEPTLETQGEALRLRNEAEVMTHPLVAEILRVFPGAVLGRVTDPALDAYGLPRLAPGPAPALGGEAAIPSHLAAVDGSADILPIDPEDGAFDPDVPFNEEG